MEHLNVKKLVTAAVASVAALGMTAPSAYAGEMGQALNPPVEQAQGGSSRAADGTADNTPYLQVDGTEDRFALAEGSRYTLVHQMYSKPADTYTVRHGLEHDVLTKDASRSTGPEYRVAAGNRVEAIGTDVFTGKCADGSGMTFELTVPYNYSAASENSAKATLGNGLGEIALSYDDAKKAWTGTTALAGEPEATPTAKATVSVKPEGVDKAVTKTSDLNVASSEDGSTRRYLLTGDLGLFGRVDATAEATIRKGAPVSGTVTIGGTGFTLKADGKGNYTASGNAADGTKPECDATVTLTYADGTAMTLKASRPNLAKPTTKDGAWVYRGETTYTADGTDADGDPVRVSVKVAYDYKVPFSEKATVTVNGENVELTKGDDGKWTGSKSLTGVEPSKATPDRLDASLTRTASGSPDQNEKAELRRGRSAVRSEITTNHEAHHYGTAEYAGTIGGDKIEFTLSFDYTAPATEKRYVTTDGKDRIDLKKGGDGNWTGVIDLKGKAPADTLQAYREWSADGVDSPLREGYELTLGTDGIRDTEPKLGVRHHEGEAEWTGDGTTVTAPVKYDEGTEVTLSEADGKGAFKAGDDGVWTATAATKAGSLTDSNEPVAKTVALSDGTVLDIDYETKVSSVSDPKGNVFVTLKGVAKGETKEGGKVKVSVTAYRAENRRVSGIKVERSKADGTSEELDVTPAFSEDVHEYSVTLPHEATGDSYTLNVAHGVDADVKAPTAKLGGGASRILTQVIEGVEWKVTVNFQAADIQSDSPAKLKGIFVNYSGEAKKGGLIKDWDPNRLDYTISVGEKDPSPYITAEWDDRLVDAKAGDIRQTADGTAQSFVVTAKTGDATRTYTVTVVRERSWKTAAEEFKPAEPVVRDATVEADSDSDTKLVSAGYEKDGRYTPSTDDPIRVPEGGAFSVEPKKGQSVSISGKRLSGMTYEYTVSVLALDGVTLGTSTYRVLYLTPKTQDATLQGIKVNGKDVEGFDPSKREYTVSVPDVAKAMVTPVFDRTLGQTVDTKRDGDVVTISVTSADGLNTVEYKVTLVSNAVAMSKDLAQTGADVALAVAAASALVAAGVGLSLAARRRGKKAETETEVETEAEAEAETGAENRAENENGNK